MLKDVIVLERRLELVFEGYCFFDLKWKGLVISCFFFGDEFNGGGVLFLVDVLEMFVGD